jgi:hypothetical protein
MSLEADYNTVKGQLDALRTALANGDASDGHHTHNELYHYRMLYNVHTLHAFNAVGWEVTRSWKHSNGETCFGGGWFVVHAETPAGQITNHYAAEHWHLFDEITEALTAPKWDRHTPEIAAQRLEAVIPFLRKRFAQIAHRATLLQHGYDDACAQRDKYMRRTVEWRNVAMNDRNRQDLDWLMSEVGWPHVRNCTTYPDPCDTCEGVKSIDERLKVLDETEGAES